MVVLYAGLAVVASLVSALLIGLSAVIGGVLPVVPSILTLNPCDLPCVYGINPGVTDAAQTRVIVQQLAGSNYSDSPAEGGSLIFRMERGDFSVLGTAAFELPTGTSVRAVGFLPVSTGNVGRLGDIMAMGFDPAFVYRTCDTTIPLLLIGFGANSRIVAESALPPRLRPDTPITFLRVYHDKGNTLGEAMISFGCLVETGWHGFVPRHVYLTSRLPV
jgi:hypothetical protein